jgi:hypothetical protein
VKHENTSNNSCPLYIHVCRETEYLLGFTLSIIVVYLSAISAAQIATQGVIFIASF